MKKFLAGIFVLLVICGIGTAIAGIRDVNERLNVQATADAQSAKLVGAVSDEAKGIKAQAEAISELSHTVSKQSDSIINQSNKLVNDADQRAEDAKKEAELWQWVIVAGMATAVFIGIFIIKKLLKG